MHTQFFYTLFIDLFLGREKKIIIERLQRILRNDNITTHLAFQCLFIQ